MSTTITEHITKNQPSSEIFSEENLPVFLFKSKLSLKPLIEKLRQIVSKKKEGKFFFGRELLAKLDAIPELHNAIEDKIILEKYQEEIALLMALMFPVAEADKDISAAIVPFEFEAFYETPAFSEVMDLRRPFDCVSNFDLDEMMYRKTLHAYFEVFKGLFGVKFSIKEPMVFIIPDKKTGLQRHFLVEFNTDFCEVKMLKNIPKPSKEELEFYKRNIFACFFTDPKSHVVNS